MPPTADLAAEAEAVSDDSDAPQRVLRLSHGDGLRAKAPINSRCAPACVQLKGAVADGRIGGRYCRLRARGGTGEGGRRRCIACLTRPMPSSTRASGRLHLIILLLLHHHLRLLPMRRCLLLLSLPSRSSSSTTATRSPWPRREEGVGRAGGLGCSFSRCRLLLPAIAARRSPALPKRALGLGGCLQEGQLDSEHPSFKAIRLRAILLVADQNASNLLNGKQVWNRHHSRVIRLEINPD